MELKMNTLSLLTKKLNKKDCPKFIILSEFMILNTNNINSILFDTKKNCKETKDDPFVEILFGEKTEKIHGLRVSQIMEAIKQGKLNDN